MLKQRILAVDDDPGTREFYAALLEDGGFEYRVVGDATAAIMASEEFRPDLLLLDWDMPGGGGAMVFEKLCTLLGRRVPVLFITGVPEKVDAGKLKSNVKVLRKPADVDTILRTVKLLLMSN